MVVTPVPSICERTAYFCQELDELTTRFDWPGLTGVGLIESRTTHQMTGAVPSERRYYITSDPAMTSESFLELTRRHWSIESMHWVLDVVFGEDASRIIDRRAAENFGLCGVRR